MSSNAKAVRCWTNEEDKLLKDALAQYKEGQDINWHHIASQMTGRSNKDCRKRWVYTLSPSINKGSWGKDEDALLLKGIQAHGYRWALVAQVVGSRQPDQCSRRWHEILNPKINRDRWSLLEDQVLKEAVQVYGRRWTEIVERYFPDRTPIAARNRYSQRFANPPSTTADPKRSPKRSPTAMEESVDPQSPNSLASIEYGDSRSEGCHEHRELTTPNLLWNVPDQSQKEKQPALSATKRRTESENCSSGDFLTASNAFGRPANSIPTSAFLQPSDAALLGALNHPSPYSDTTTTTTDDTATGTWNLTTPSLDDLLAGLFPWTTTPTTPATDPAIPSDAEATADMAPLQHPFLDSQQGLLFADVGHACDGDVKGPGFGDEMILRRSEEGRRFFWGGSR